VGHNQVSRSEIVKLFGDLVFATPKPEKLMKRIIGLATQEGDLVLDFFLGSGTTTAVAHKMERRYIGIEQMDYIKEVAVARLRKVIEGEQGGVSGETHWKGGGSFVYMELAEANATRNGNNGGHLNFSEMESNDHKASPTDILLNQKFYSLGS
jgi:adenine-specific DNA-methyltransferase